MNKVVPLKKQPPAAAPSRRAILPEDRRASRAVGRQACLALGALLALFAGLGSRRLALLGAAAAGPATAERHREFRAEAPRRHGQAERQTMAVTFPPRPRRLPRPISSPAPAAISTSATSILAIRSSRASCLRISRRPSSTIRSRKPRPPSARSQRLCANAGERRSRAMSPGAATSLWSTRAG